MSIILTVHFILLLVLYFVYKYLTRNYNHWAKKGIPYIKPIPIFGNLLGLFTFKRTLSETLACFYKECNSPYFGVYVLNKPSLVIKSPELIKTILIKDFHYFNDRSVFSDEQCDAMIANMLFFVKNPQWKTIRAKMSPTFTMAKQKNMFPLMKIAASEMLIYLNEHYKKDFIECKELCAKYSTDVITSCAFGLNAHCFENENAMFRLISRQMFDTSVISTLKQFSYFMGHTLAKFFKMSFFDIEIYRILREVFWETLKKREQTGVQRHDVIDVMIQFLHEPDLIDDYKFEGDRVLAQAAQYFSAGFETISATISFTLYELSLQPEVQEKLREEIKRNLLQYEEIDFTIVQKMDYLSIVVDETLRKYPSLAFLERRCVANYKVPNDNFIIEKGTAVFIPLLGLHYDPEHFPNPELYDPDRFLDENIKSSCTYLPFGIGPRNCIGAMFGLTVTKLGLFSILSQFKVETTPKTPVPIQFSKKSIFLSSSVGIPLKFTKIDKFEQI